LHKNNCVNEIINLRKIYNCWFFNTTKRGNYGYLDKVQTKCLCE